MATARRQLYLGQFSQHKIQRFWGEACGETSKGEGVYHHGAQQSVGEGPGYKGAPRPIVLLGKRFIRRLINIVGRQTDRNMGGALVEFRTPWQSEEWLFIGL